MPATKTDLTIEQGVTWSHGWAVTYNGTPIDDTWTAASQVREGPTSAAILHTFSATVNPDGSVVIGVTAAESTAWAWRTGRYDVEVTNADDTVTLRVAQGSVTVSLEVTK